MARISCAVIESFSARISAALASCKHGEGLTSRTGLFCASFRLAVFQALPSHYLQFPGLLCSCVCPWTFRRFQAAVVKVAAPLQAKSAQLARQQRQTQVLTDHKAAFTTCATLLSSKYFRRTCYRKSLVWICAA